MTTERPESPPARLSDRFFEQAAELRDEGIPFATATVVRAERPTSAKPGDKAIVTVDGVMRGWIGGSCAQPTVVREALRALADDRARLVRLSPDPESETPVDGMEVAAMSCYSGGTLDVYIEPQAPRPHLRIAGHLPVAQALLRFAQGMGYRVTAVVTPGEQASMAGADTISTRWADLAQPARPLTYVVVATHGHDDEEALEHALASGAAYVGLVASPKRAQAVRDYLKLRGFGPADLERLESPAGLDIGARQGDEIALSILAEIVRHRRAEQRLDWPRPTAESQHGAEVPAGEIPAGEIPAGEIPTAIDPICGMKVALAGARHVLEPSTPGGERVYFCCGGCLARYRAQLEAETR